MLAGLNHIYKDLIRSDYFVKILFLTLALQTAFGLEKAEGNLLLNFIIVWVLIPFLFVISIFKSKLLIKDYLPPELVLYFFFIILILFNYPQITDMTLYLIVLRKVILVFVMFVIVNHALKTRYSAINIVFLSILVGSVILAYLNVARATTREVGFAHSDEIDELFALTDTDTRINSNGLSTLAVNGVLGVLFLLNPYRKSRLWLLACVPILIYVNVAAASKSGFFNMMTVICLWYIFCVAASSKNRGFYLILFLVLSALFYLYIDKLLKGTYLLARFSELGENYYKEDARGQLIQKGLDVFFEYPVFGVGLGQLATYAGAYSHNDFVEVLSNTGIIGGLLYFSIYIILLSRISRLLRRPDITAIERMNVRFCKVIIFTILIRGISVPNFSQFNEMFLIGITISYTFYLEKRSNYALTLLPA